MPAPNALRFCFSLIKYVRVNDQEDRCTQNRGHNGPEGSYTAKETAYDRNHTRYHEQDTSNAMDFIPNIIAGERPRCSDADEPVAFCLAQHGTDDEEQQSYYRQHGFADAQVCVTQVPAYG